MPQYQQNTFDSPRSVLHFKIILCVCVCVFCSKRKAKILKVLKNDILIRVAGKGINEHRNRLLEKIKVEKQLMLKLNSSYE